MTILLNAGTAYYHGWLVTFFFAWVEEREDEPYQETMNRTAEGIVLKSEQIHPAGLIL